MCDTQMKVNLAFLYDNLLTFEIKCSSQANYKSEKKLGTKKKLPFVCTVGSVLLQKDLTLFGFAKKRIEIQCLDSKLGVQSFLCLVKNHVITILI